MIFKRVECGYCHKEMLILEEYVRETMFCTLGCINKSDNYQNLMQSVIKKFNKFKVMHDFRIYELYRQVKSKKFKDIPMILF